MFLSDFVMKVTQIHKWDDRHPTFYQRKDTGYNDRKVVRIKYRKYFLGIKDPPLAKK